MADVPPRRRGFPPGIGWIPYVIAVAITLVVGSVAVLPRFSTTVIGTTPLTGGGSLAPGQTPGPGGTTGTGTGSGTTTTTGPGSRGTGSGPGTTLSGGGGQIDCAHGRNGGATAPGITATQIQVASTVVSPSSSSVGAGFLGEAADGMQAAINQIDNAGGICGRLITNWKTGAPGIYTLNTNWDQRQGNTDIAGWVGDAHPPFALVGEPDSEGLEGAINAGTIDGAGIPVVGSDGMLKAQYHDPWVFPVAASTVTNMHIIADYAVNTLHANSFGIVFDSKYNFGVEGASAFAKELIRQGKSINGYDPNNPSSTGCTNAYCGIDPSATSYSSAITTFNGACAPCDVVVMLLEPGPMEAWMGKGGEDGNTGWYRTLEGGEPLFDNSLANNCASCGGPPTPLHVWTGYCVFQSSDPGNCSQPAVSSFCTALRAVNPNDDCQNEFTQGAYLGTRLFITALQRLASANLPVTRANLAAELNQGSYDLGLSEPLQFSSGAHVSNSSMAAYHENFSGSFNGWTYDSTGFIADRNKNSDL
ncbi:MAG: ABC transporter substrate-binding protein [Candidatus Dormibacteria bacterium]